MRIVLLWFVVVASWSGFVAGQGLLDQLGLGGLGKRLGLDVSGRGQGGSGGQGGMGDLGEMINNVAGSFLAPQPHTNGPPPHVLRRIMRFCSRHPNHPRCQGHPEWIGSGLPSLPKITELQGLNLNDLSDMFPDLMHFKLPPIPKLNLPDVLNNVPAILKQVIPAPILGQLTDIARRALQANCQNGKCKVQKPEILSLRADIAERESLLHRLSGQGLSQSAIDQKVETRFARTQQVKKALLKKAGLDNLVEPENDGAFQKDILLTEEQANVMLNEINGGEQVPLSPAGSPTPTGKTARRHRSALFLEDLPAQRWPNDRPIEYMFDQSLSVVDQNNVHAAIREIEAKTCVRFKFVTTKPAHSHIYYMKVVAPSICGLSYIGRVEPVNTVYLTFVCGNPVGIAIHETLHALGLNHEQLRGDRDKFITINWANVNPQNYDFFAVADSKQFTSYGVQYDYGSIMHYNQFIASQNPGKPTMTAKNNPAVNNPLMGQRKGLSARDIEIVEKMYCNPDCIDKNVYCGAWALSGFCTAPGQKGWLELNCKKSCNLC